VKPMLVYDIFGLGFMASQNSMEQGMPDYTSNRNYESFSSLNLLGSEILLPSKFDMCLV
jgi:hypothetical protein